MSCDVVVGAWTFELTYSLPYSCLPIVDRCPWQCQYRLSSVLHIGQPFLVIELSSWRETFSVVADAWRTFRAVWDSEIDNSKTWRLE